MYEVKTVGKKINKSYFSKRENVKKLIAMEKYGLENVETFVVFAVEITRSVEVLRSRPREV